MFKNWLKLQEDANANKYRQLLRDNGFTYYGATRNGEQWEKDGIITTTHVHNLRNPQKMYSQMLVKHERNKAEQQRLRNKRVA
jgi:hypothetical protein